MGSLNPAGQQELGRWILKPRVWFHRWECTAVSPLLLFELFMPPPDAKGEDLGCCSLGFHGGRWVQILQLSHFPRVPPRPCTLLHSVPRLQSEVSYFCPLTALEAAELSKVILQLIWSLRCAAVVLPGRVSLGAGCCRYENVLSEVPEVRRRTP